MHKRYVFSNVIGTFIFNEHFSMINKILFKNIADYHNKERFEQQLIQKYKNMHKPDEKEIPRILSNFKNPDLFREFYRKNLALTKQKIKESVKEDMLIIQSINNIRGIDKVINTLVKNLREWYSLYDPEFSEKIKEHEKFVSLMLGGYKRESLMGSDLAKKDLEPMLNLAKQISSLYDLKKRQELYLESLMNSACPNMTAIAGHLTGAKLIEIAGSLKHLAELPASTIQLLGAEEALFRHLKTGSLCPKYGVVYSHNLIQKARKCEQGKVARALSDKIAIAVKVDYFKGKFIGNKLRKELEERFSTKDDNTNKNI